MTASADRKPPPLSARPAKEQNSFRRQEWLFVLLIVLAVLAAYLNSFSGPFIFDDLDSIVKNPTIRDLAQPAQVLFPPPGALTVSGRPLLNLSLAINYALGGTSVFGYHAGNLLIHLLATLVLFGILRRTLLQPLMRDRFGPAALPLSAAIALLWAVHPLQTESVTYIVQRSESLMGLFYLLTLYCVIRAAAAPGPRWSVLAFLACLCGMTVKEVMVTAPLMALLYDRTFLAGTFRKALHARWRLYLALAGTWLVLAWLLATGGQVDTGPNSLRPPAARLGYAETQFWAVVHYLKLSVWPHPLILDFGGPVLIQSAAVIVPCAAMIVALLAATIICLRRGMALGFAGAWFFGILALTSSIFPLGDTVFEHRMYLPLAAVVAVAALLIYRQTGRWSRIVFLVAWAAFTVLTVRRNEDYRSDLAIWTDTVARRPDNARAHCSLGLALRRRGQLDEAVEQYQTALQLQPGYADAHNNLGVIFLSEQRFAEAAEQFALAIGQNPRDASSHNNLGAALYREGRLDDAIAELQESLRLRPDDSRTRSNLDALLDEERTSLKPPAGPGH